MKTIRAISIENFDPMYGFRTIPKNTIGEFRIHRDGEIRLMNHEFEIMPGHGYIMSKFEFDMYFREIRY